MLNVIVSRPGVELAQSIAARSEPGPLSRVFVTTVLQAGTTTRVVTVVVLLPEIGSGWSPLTVTLLTIIGLAMAFTVIWFVTRMPAASKPRLQVTVPPTFVHPEEAETNIAPAGNASVILAPVAEQGPLLVTMIV